MIVRWGLEELPALAGERPLVVASPRWRGVLDAADRWEEVPSHRIEVPEGVDTLVAVGGGSAIDTAKAASAASGLPLVSVPTTYSGAEWTEFFGVRDPDRKLRGGGAGARLHAIVYEPELTLDLPRRRDRRHGAERARALRRGALRRGAQRRGRRRGARGSAADRQLAAAGGRAPRRPRGANRSFSAAPVTRERRSASRSSRSGTRWRRGSAAATASPHGALNALTLPPALRFNQPVAAEAIARFGEALGSDDPAARVEELARLGGFERLRDLGIPEDAPAERRRAGRGPPRRPGEPAAGHPGGCGGTAALDLVKLSRCRLRPCRRGP